MLKRPRGGLWLELKKLPTVQRPIEELKAPSKLYLPLRQFVGTMSVICVNVGDRVYKGQQIAEAGDDISCPLHSPVSGVVKDITEYTDPAGLKSPMIVIENDFQNTPYGRVSKVSDEMDKESLLKAIKLSGAVDAGNRKLPLWVRTKDILENMPDTIILNAVETEPYICCSQKIIEENPDEITEALKIIMKVTEAKKLIIAMSDDVPVEITNDISENTRLAGLKTTVAHIPQKYPNGNEQFLVRRLFAKEIAELDKKGIDPSDKNLKVGFIKPQDLLNIQRAVKEGLAETTRVITVAGDAIKNPQNLEVPIGTTVRDILEHCELSFDPDRIVLGSAMRGVAVTDLNVPITKDVSAVLALKAVRGGLKKSICINCGKCVKVCPQGLMPNYIAMRAVKADFDALKELKIDECIECGSCAYICPGRMPIVELIKNIKKAAL